MSNHKLERAELEKKYQRGDQRMMRDFASLKDLFTVRRTALFVYVNRHLPCIHSFSTSSTCKSK
jgi:hypothetical protein